MLHEIASEFLNIETIADLCSILNISENQLKYILFVKKSNYRKFSIPKKNGGVRMIASPNFDLKIIQKKLCNLLYDIYNAPSFQHGFIRGKNCITNASIHTNKRYVLNIDIENFFDNIHFGRVRGMFLKSPFNFNNMIATILAKIVCYNRCLPQGAPTSPIISNILCYSMDKKLNRLAIKNRCKYTRYADDMTFSTNSEKFPEEIAKIFDKEIVVSDKMLEIISGGYENGFKLNIKKTRIAKKMMRQEVTGIVVNEKTNVEKSYIRKIRSLLHNIQKNGYLRAARKHYGSKTKNSNIAKNKLFNELQGKLNYLKTVRGHNDKLFLKYAKQFNSIFEIDFFDIDVILDLEDYVRNRCYVIQSENESSQGTAFGLNNKWIYTSTHIFINETTYPNFIHNHNNKQYSDQFPLELSDGRLPFFKICNCQQDKVVDYFIDEGSYLSDILAIKNSPFSKTFEISTDNVKISDKVYLIGYPAFVNYKQSDINIIETKVIGIGSLFGRTFLRTIDSPIHGMSGGPVLNADRKVVGIVYAGADLENDYQSDNVGFIDLVNK